jgi:hypothetical protein
LIPYEDWELITLILRGLYYSTDKGITWIAMPVGWKEKYINQDPQRRHRNALLVMNKDF